MDASSDDPTEKWVVCRICLKESMEMQKIFDGEAKSGDLTAKIQQCGGIQLHSADNMPDKMCTKCLLMLRVAHKFRTTCQRSDQQLRKVLLPATANYVDAEEQQLPENNDVEQQGEVTEDPKPAEELMVVKTELAEQQRTSDMHGFELVEYMDMTNEQVEYLHDDSSVPSVEDEYVTYIGHEQEHYSEATENEHEPPVAEFSAEKYANTDKEKDATVGSVMHTDDNEEASEECNDRRPGNIANEHKTVTISKAMTRRHPSRAVVSLDRMAKAQRHQKHTGHTEPSFQCSYCCNVYTEKAKLNLHLKIHTREKPHQCEICQKRFAQSPQLARHMNSHTGNKPYKCSFCPANFADPSTLCKHERIHNKLRPYKCETCGKAFSYTNVLKVHIMTHTGEKPHECIYCGKRFSQLHHMKAHLRTHRSE